MKQICAMGRKRSGLFGSALVGVLAVFLLAGCAGTMAETQKKGISSIADKDYVIPKKPVDKHAIGWAWSKQFGPVEDANADEIQIKKEKSFNNMQQDLAYNIGLGLGAQSVLGAPGEAAAPSAAPASGGAADQGAVSAQPGVPAAQTPPASLPGAVGGKFAVQRGKADRSKMEGVEIIGPVSLADVPFEPNVPYITEALRLANFKLSNESSLQAGIGASANAGIGSATAMLEGGVHGRRGLEGEGLVVAYKLHRIDTKSYAKAESGNQRLELDKSVDFPKGNVIVKARLQAIEPGAKKSLPRNLLWSCPRAEAASRDMVAAWIVEIRSTDPKRKSLAIAFPAFPKVEDCQSYQGTIFSRIDPVTDKIVRQRINLTIVEAEVSDAMKPTAWDARVSLIDESFNVRLVNPSEMGN